MSSKIYMIMQSTLLSLSSHKGAVEPLIKIWAMGKTSSLFLPESEVYLHFFQSPMLET